MTTGYRELAAILRAAILRGEYAEGATLPKQEEIATLHGVRGR
ncbi:DNA-binding GntR family transcriptional regulator [Catenuloplanes nepalensis]|uniref:DNA-binding GntR family transcriptional regulator n=1 Tax=Catenuloplanes nepalensis TaxID=587533 RepID=A0ABT9N4H3_9ACTN|nr:GntR family transcriptional regulator [Catenuloplanes nepalensis]MDP9798610.1 DNA-binding GntR family transcriptional regulator [Catenuloplanes nepalensis]